MTFDNLAQNQTYQFKIYDTMGDGIFGNHGSGMVDILDDNTVGRSTVLFTMSSMFGAYYEVDVEIGSFGQATIVDESSDYQPSSWPDLENLMLAPPPTTSDTTAWPGAFPLTPTSSLVVNLELYEHLEEVSWELFHTNNTSTTVDDDNNIYAWLSIGNWSGTLAPELGSSVTRFDELAPGWYRFVIKDSAGNGLASPAFSDSTAELSNPPEFVTLTGPLSYTKDLGLVWGSNGQFEDQEEIWFLMDTTGYISHIRFVTDKNARGLPPSISPSPSASPSISLSQSDTLAPTVAKVAPPTPPPQTAVVVATATSTDSAFVGAPMELASAANLDSRLLGWFLVSFSVAVCVL